MQGLYSKPIYFEKKSKIQLCLLVEYYMLVGYKSSYEASGEPAKPNKNEKKIDSSVEPNAIF